MFDLTCVADDNINCVTAMAWLMLHLLACHSLRQTQHSQGNYASGEFGAQKRMEIVKTFGEIST